MIDALYEKCDLLLQNYTVINKQYLFDDALLCLSSSLIFTSADTEADTEKLSSCKKTLEKNTGFLSNLRGNAKLVIMSKMALSDDPEKYLADVMDVYEKIHQGSQLESSYMVLAAILICDLGRQDEAEDLIVKADQICGLMDTDHPILTAPEDTSFIMLLALTDKSVDTIISDIREAYDYLKNTCKISRSANGIQGLSEVLAASYGDTKDKCDKAVRIINSFKAHGVKYGTDTELSVLGSLIDLNIDTDTLVNAIIETDALLKENKGFKDNQMDETKRLMYASMLAAEVYGKQSPVIGNSIISNTISAVIAKQISLAATISFNLISAVIPKGDDD